MKKSTLTEDKAEQTPTGGVLVGKRKGQTIIHNKGTLSGYLVGRTHAEGGIKAVNKSTGQALEMQGGEVVITAPAVSDNTKNEFNGKMMTNREVLSTINEKGGGVSFAKGGDIPKNIKRTGASYKYGGKTMTDHEICKHITGGHLAEGMTLSQIAKKHNVSLKELQKQVDLGMKAESEHTSSKREQMKIVKDHLFENPNYYNLLKKAGLEYGGNIESLYKNENDYVKHIVKTNLLLGVEEYKLKEYLKRKSLTNVQFLPENVRLDPEYRKLKIDFDIAFKRLQNYSIYKYPKNRDRVQEQKDRKKAKEISDKIIQIKLKNETFKKGGEVKSLIEDVKGGNSPSLDLNSYNDLLDIQADGIVGANSGLFANGGALTTSFAKGGITDGQTSTQKGETLIKEELEQSKIWIGNDLRLRDLVMAKLNKIGLAFDKGYGDKDLYETENIYISIYTDDFVVYQGIKKQYFNNDSKKEIFPSDLGIFPSDLKKLSTDLLDETITDEDVEIKKLILAFIKEGSWSLEKEIKTKTGDSSFKEFYKSEPPTIYRLTAIRGQGLYPTDPNTLKFLEKIGMYDDYEEPVKETSSGKFSAEKIEVFKLIGMDDGISSTTSIYGATELLQNLKLLESKFSERQNFPYRIYDFYGIAHDTLNIGRGIKTPAELITFIMDIPYYQDYDWAEFFAIGTEIVEQPKPSKTDKPKRNFELERKYLSQRISDLAKELELKKPILSNEEVAFYQREINSFILKLRKLNDAEMSLKSIEERVRGVYDLKISSFENQYPETDMTSINALKSQLTEKEYFNVRTPEFKSFFGDWETAYLTDSYAGVSKAINPITKEPQPVFHGTNVLFVDWKTYDTNNAHYFAVKREMSEFFATSWEQRSDKAGVDSEILKKLNPNRGSFLLRCFIDIKNPVDFSRFGVDKYPIREYLTFLRVNYNIGDFDFWTNITSHSGFTQDTEVYAWQIIRLWQSFTKYIKVFTMYDGYIFYEYIPTKPYGGLENASLSYCAFESNQIKFTDAYEFNALSNDSRFDLGGIL